MCRLFVGICNKSNPADYTLVYVWIKQKKYSQLVDINSPIYACFQARILFSSSLPMHINFTIDFEAVLFI